MLVVFLSSILLFCVVALDLQENPVLLQVLARKAEGQEQGNPPNKSNTK